jgi:hypothetical protein
MGLDFDALKAKLNKFTKQDNRQDSLWRPEEGKTTIRIVPWAKNRKNPFIEMYFHYIGGKTQLSPLTFDRPDPIAEFAEKIVDDARPHGREAEKVAYGQARDFRPKLRTYVPVIVRGEEHKGVRFYSFGKTVYQELLGYMTDPDYGDITDPKNGRDVVLEHIPKEKSDTKMAKTSVRVKPTTSPLVSDIELAKNLLTNQPDLYAIFEEPSYDALVEFLQKYLDPDGESDDTNSPQSVSNEVLRPNIDDSGFGVDTDTPPVQRGSNIVDALDEFDKLFDD